MKFSTYHQFIEIFDNLYTIIIIEIHDIEINKSFRLLVLFGNGYKASMHFNLIIAECYIVKIYISKNTMTLETVFMLQEIQA